MSVSTRIGKLQQNTYQISVHLVLFLIVRQKPYLRQSPTIGQPDVISDVQFQQLGDVCLLFCSQPRVNMSRSLAF